MVQRFARRHERPRPRAIRGALAARRRRYNVAVTTAIDDLMERASGALVATDYLGCEQLCLDALRAAREKGDWAYYARILLPLQESRRQRRMIAADGFVRLGTSDLEGPHRDWSGSFPAGCIVVTRPFTPQHATALVAALGQQGRCIEVLFADNAIDEPRWRIRSIVQSGVSVERPAPPMEWLDRWLSPDEVRSTGEPGPDDWFIDATEALGDAALEHVTAPEGSIQRIEQLEVMLAAAGDHEILHQRLGDAARAAARA